MIIDSHCHVYPSLKDYISKKESFSFTENKSPSELKSTYRLLVKPYLNGLHKLQEKSRSLPKELIPACDKLITLFGAWNTLIENGVHDLNIQIQEKEIDYSFIIAHPPIISNQFVLSLAKKYKNILPIVNIEPSEQNPVEKLKEFRGKGAIALKIHAASDGLNENSAHYNKLLSYANSISLPVIIHTGCIHIKPIFKDPKMGHAEHFEKWFTKYPNCHFILAHMNYHYPNKAIEFCQKYPNVYTDTSWQPKESIVKAINKIGADKIMFGSDWPLIGDNINYCYSQLREGFNDKSISKEDFNKIRGMNAIKVFNLENLL